MKHPVRLTRLPLAITLAAALLHQTTPARAAGDEIMSGEGVLELVIAPGTAGDLAERMLKTHAVKLRSPALIQSVVQNHEGFRKSAFFQSIQKQQLDPLVEIRKRLRADVVPGTLLIRIFVDSDDLEQTDRRVLICSVADEYIKNCQRANNDQTNLELVTATQAAERLDRRLAAVKDIMAKLLEVDPPTPAVATELTALQEERHALMLQRHELDAKVASLRSQLRIERSDIRWAEIPAVQ